MINYFRDKNQNSKKKYKKFETLTPIIESVDTVVIVGATTKSATFSVAVDDLIVVPISARIGCTLALGNVVINKIVKKKYDENKKHYEKDQQNYRTF